MALSAFKGTDGNSKNSDISGQVYAEQCTICESDYLNPKSLKCLHSFCLKCLAEKVTCESKITCPTCDEETELPSKGVEGLTTNFMLIEKRERSLFEKRLKEEDSCIPCTSCKTDSKKKAIAWCRQCLDYMCEVAVTYHKELRITKDHDIISLEILQSEGIPKRADAENRICPKHKDEKLKFYCETCEAPFCRDCEIIDHPRGENHAQVYLEDAIRKRSSDIQKEAEKCKHIRQDIDETIAQDEKVQAAHQKAVDQALKAYDVAAKHIQDTFSDKQKHHMDTFVDDLTRFDEQRKQDIEDHKEKLKNIRSRLTSALAVAQMLAETGSQYDVADMYKDVITALRELRDFQPEAECLSEITFNVNEKCHSIVASIPAPGTLKIGGKVIWEQKIKFGSGILSGARGLAFAPTGEVFVADYSAREAKLFDGQGTLSKTLQQATAGFSNPFDVSYSPDGCFYMSDQSVAVKQITSQIVYTATRNIGYGSHGVATNTKNGNMAVACTGDNYIFIYDSNGTQKHLITTVMAPNFIAITSNDYCVCSSDTHKSVLLVNATGHFIRVIGPPPDIDITAWSPKGVCCSTNDDIYVANQGAGAMGNIRFKVSGDFIDCVATGLNNPWGLAISGDDELVAVVDDNGTSVTVFGHKNIHSDHAE